MIKSICQHLGKGNEPMFFFLIPLQVSKEFPFPAKNPCVYAKQLPADGFEPADRINASCKDCRMLDCNVHLGVSKQAMMLLCSTNKFRLSWRLTCLCKVLRENIAGAFLYLFQQWLHINYSSVSKEK